MSGIFLYQKLLELNVVSPAGALLEELPPQLADMVNMLIEKSIVKVRSDLLEIGIIVLSGAE